MSSPNELPALVRLLLKSLDAVSHGLEATEKAAAAAGRDIKNSARALTGKATSRHTLPVGTRPAANTETLEESLARLEASGDAKAIGINVDKVRKQQAKLKKRSEKKTAEPRRKATLSSLRGIAFPDASQVEPDRKNWAQTKSIASFLGAALIGGTTGIFLYAIPLLFPALALTALPFFAIGAMVRTLGLMLPKGGDLRTSMKRIANKCFATGTVIALLPMVATGIPAFMALHTGLTLAGDPLFARKKAASAPTATPVDSTPAAAPARNWVSNLGQSFGRALGRKTAQPAAEPAPAAEATRSPAAPEA